MVTKALRLVTLDVTNTLIRVAKSPGYQYAYVAHKHGVYVDDKLLTDLFIKYYKEYSHKYPNFGVTCMMPATVWWALLVKDCFRSADSTIDTETLDKLASDLYFHYTTPKAWEVLPGALNALKDLRQYPVKIGVISNWDHRLYKVLSTMKLRQYFDFVLPSYVVGVEKPDSLIFQQALQNGMCEPNEAVHFGDNIEKDFIGARNMGMNAYLLATHGIKHSFLDQLYVVHSVQDFVDAIRPNLGEQVEQRESQEKQQDVNENI